MRQNKKEQAKAANENVCGFAVFYFMEG